MKDLYAPDKAVKYEKILESMAPITKTASAVLEQVISGSIKLTQSTGNNDVLLWIIFIMFDLMYFIMYVIRI